MSENKALVRKRGAIKAQLTSFRKYFESLGKALSEIEILELEQRLKRAKGLLSEYDVCYNDIIASVEESEADEHHTHREDFERFYFKICAEAQGLINKLRTVQLNDESCSQVGSRHSSAGDFHRDSVGNARNVKLPTLKLPQFDGSYDKWLSFYDTFKSVIHANDSISTVQKFHYLNSSLVGEAAQVIQGLEISDANYEAAWQILKKRYRNKPLMVHNHIKGIVEFPKLTKQCCSTLRNLLNAVQSHTRALQALEEPVDNWDSLLIYLIVDKFDTHTRGEWEKLRVEDNEMPKFTDIMEFMEKQCRLLEKMSKQSKTSIEQQRIQDHGGQRQARKSISSNAVIAKSNCPICNQSHALYSCKTFLDLPIQSRISEVKQHGRCLNCLRAGHISINCQGTSCRKCSRKHNTLLHLDNPVDNKKQDQVENKAQRASIEDQSSTITTHAGSKGYTCQVLPTARIQILDNDGNIHECNALLDSGSQSNFLSARLCKILNLPTTNINLNVTGINQSESIMSQRTKATIKSKCTNLEVTLDFLILPKVTSNLPSESIDVSQIKIPENIKLADDQFYRPKRIDVLIGVDIFWDLLCPEAKTHPYIHKTKLGYVISGRIPSRKLSTYNTSCNLSFNLLGLSEQMKKFWEVEECPKMENWSPEEKACELSFTQNTKRDINGRFIVTIPLKDSLDSLGESKERAERRFIAMEHKLQRNQTLKQRYVEFMDQYQQLGHMTMIEEKESPEHVYYLPHHGVLKEDSLTTKLRVVFDGSAKSTSGVSINDLHMVGPTIQRDLQSILISFRQYPFVVGADISMMYRQVLITPEQRDLQRILWRPNPTEPIRIFQLNTITYGLASSSFLAIRCLFQLAEENEQISPKIADVIRKCMYVDDLLYGSNTIDEAIEIQKQITALLNSGNFQLRKWISNEPKILDQIQNAKEHLPCLILRLGENEVNKTLGLSWACYSDELIYDISGKLDLESSSKRDILSVIARIYDPLGLLSPCIIKAKIILQRLWLLKATWDEPLPSNLQNEWKKFVRELSALEKLNVPRQVCCTSPVIVEIHGFSDASEVAYGACVYIRSIDSFGAISVNLLLAKSKVAPLKPLTIPKLELCAAQLLARLVSKVKDSLEIAITGVHYWCDSTIVLSWLKMEPYTLKTFVSNRVCEIQALSKTEDWHYIASQENPADLPSRGIDPTYLRNSALWWKGPSLLSSHHLNLTPIVDIDPELPELKPASRVTAISNSRTPVIKFDRYSNLDKLQRIVAYCLRYISNLRKSKEKQRFHFITIEEIQNAEIELIKISQQQSFTKELKELSTGRNMNPKGRLSGLNPFIHRDGTLRVGGRLGNSDYDFNKRHPIIICAKHHLTKLIFERKHKRLLHASPQNLLSCIREKYWPISGRNLARKVVHECVTCFKANPRSLNPLMGHLPRDRVTPAPAFYVTGVDYAGPYTIKDRKGRGSKTSKCYIALFICFVTRGIHLELVSDLTSDCFILALRRFASRWGMPGTLYSDNGTNFVGANSELKELGNFLLRNKNSLNDRFARESFNWKFIPSYSPHFGGIWEAGVKSTKYHLRRIMGTALMTFEEFYSLLAQISAILNSRPLTPLSADPLDLNPLTPAHLLVGRSLTTVPDPDVTFIKESHLSRYQHIQQLQQNFWKRWSKEYISELQCRTKWKINKHSIQEGSLVLIKDDNAPPMRWQLGRVIQLHPGNDSVVRVVSLRTKKGIIKRAVTKLCPLPVEAQD